MCTVLIPSTLILGDGLHSARFGSTWAFYHVQNFSAHLERNCSNGGNAKRSYLAVPATFRSSNHDKRGIP